MNKFIDTHAHIYAEYYSDIPSLINTINDFGVTRVINAGCDLKTSVEVLELSEEYPSLSCAIGIHPENVMNYTDLDIKQIEKYLANTSVVAIGEIGLDYHYTKDNKELQKELFKKQLKLAENHNLPVVIHSREATEDTINILKEFKVTGVIHSFSGSLETAKEYIKMGFALGVNGVVTFKNAKLKYTLKEIDLKHIVLETDSPYLSPEPKRGKKNHPGNIPIIAEFLTEVYNLSLEEIAKITSNNAHRIFDKMP